MPQKKIRAKKHLSFGSFEVLALSANKFDIKKEVPEATINKLKETEAHPFLQAYVICHEGEFTPEIVGEKSQSIVWSEDSVKTFSDINVIGAKLFYGHDTREVMGDIIHSTFKMIDGKECFVIVAHHPADKVAKAEKCDICSQEAVWETIEFNGKLYADKVTELLGVAIQQSTNDRPAFSGATKIAQVRATQAEEKIMTVAEVLQGIKDLNIQPYQAFDLERIKNDPVLGKQIPDIEPLKAQLQEKDTKIKELQDSKQNLEKDVAKQTSKPRLDKIVKEKNCTPKQKTFLEKQLETFGLEDYSDDGLSSFVENNLKVFKNVMSVKEPDKKPVVDEPEGEDNDSYVDDSFDPDEILGG